MKKSYSLILSLAVLMGMTGIGVVSAQDAEDPKLIEVGKKLFFDANLSANGTQSCAACHGPEVGLHRPGCIGKQGGRRLSGRHPEPLRQP